MGLLDFMNTDDPQQAGLLSAAAQMLAASGPSRTPTSFGQIAGLGLMSGMQGYGEAKKRKLDMDKEQFQMDYLKQQIAQAATKSAKDQRLQDFIVGKLGGVGTMPAPEMAASTEALQQGAAAGSVGPTVANASRMDAIMPQSQRQQPGAFPFSLNDVTMLHALGGPNLADAFKLATDPTKLEGGSTYVDRSTGKREYMPKLDNGMMPNGRFMPGYAEEVARQAGLTSSAQEGAKANYDVLDPTKFTLSGGAPFAGTRADFIARTRGMQTGAEGLDTSRLTPQQRSFLQQQDPEAYRNGVERLNSSTQPAGFSLQSEAEREASVGGARVRNAVDEAVLKNYPDYVKQRQNAIAGGEQTISIINKALQHPGLSTATGLSGTLDPRNYVSGTHAKDFQVVLDQIKGKAFLQAFESLKGGGQITEVEGQKATDAIARLNRAQSTGEFMNSLNDLRDVAESGMSRMKSTPDPLEMTRQRVGGSQPSNAPAQSAAPAKSWADHGYSSQQAVIRDAQNTILRNPSAKAEVIRRLEAAGITNHGVR